MELSHGAFAHFLFERTSSQEVRREYIILLAPLSLRLGQAITEQLDRVSLAGVGYGSQIFNRAFARDHVLSDISMDL